MSLHDLRLKIDHIDKELIHLINDRTDIVLEIGKLKDETGLKHYYPEREKKIHEKIMELNKGKFPNKVLINIFKEIISASRSLEKNIKVAYLGPEGTYSHAACVEFFGSSTENFPLSRIQDVFFEVEKEKVDYGIVPVENSYEGLVSYTVDMFLDSPLIICAEYLFRVEHCLIGNVTELSQIKKLYSHPQPLGQCRVWLDSHLPHVEKIDASSTSKAAEIAAWDKFSAAIASETAAYINDLNIIAKNIEDSADNLTRFLIIGKHVCEPTDSDKTSILCKIQDKPGALLNILRPFQEQKLNLTKIESRPSKRKAWDYVFFIDVEGHISNPAVKKAIEDVKEHCLEVRHLGSYPKHTEIKDNRKPLNNLHIHHGGI